MQQQRLLQAAAAVACEFVAKLRTGCNRIKFRACLAICCVADGLVAYVVVHCSSRLCCCCAVAVSEHRWAAERVNATHMQAATSSHIAHHCHTQQQQQLLTAASAASLHSHSHGHLPALQHTIAQAAAAAAATAATAAQHSSDS